MIGVQVLLQKNNTFTILIQGPLRNSLYKEYLEEYKKYGEIILVIYDDDNLNIEKQNEHIKVIKIKYPDLSNIFNFNNTFLQTYGILQGLKVVNTEFVIRVRSDESYPNMDKFIYNIKNNPEKIHVSNLYSFKDNICKYALGNHIFAGRTHLMLKAFEWALKSCTIDRDLNIYEDINLNGGHGNKVLNFIDKNGNIIYMWSEILQTISFLKAKNVEIDLNNSRQQIIENFYMTPLRDFPGFKWSHKFNNYEPITKDTKMEYDASWEDSFTNPNIFMTKIEDI